MKKLKISLLSVAAATLMLSGCSSDNEAEEFNPNAAPQNITWVDVQGISVPVNPTTYGPKDSSGVVAHKYEHSPQGAALAAIGTSARLAVAPDDRWDELVGLTVQPNEARDQWIIARAQSHVEGIDEEARPTITGYYITAYDDKAAEVDVYSTYPDNSMAKAHTRVVWAGEDWKLDLSSEQRIEEVESMSDGAVTLQS
ncbi:hypothetical protein L1O03_02875 [Corynebacterium uropygiale]|uniref:DUF8175 domain-containing protein n=1 Tax=Corynebacterium uropygiale TaxID=1775911 RepID=A0A9X1QNW9_9CORY|nr:hypothetical protein [Corynebacterium uropygiale]MCF4006121.1 hypothetical protein [Corynebacterium uropygiale]